MRQALRLAFLCLLWGCSKGTPEAAPSPLVVAPEVMPTVRRIAFRNQVDTFALDAESLALSSGGVLLLSGRIAEGDLRLHLLNPASDSLVSFGRAGEGPGEVAQSARLAAFGDTFAVIRSGVKQLEFSDRGKLLGEMRLTNFGGLQLLARHDLADVWEIRMKQRPNPSPAYITRFDLKGDSHRLLLPVADSFIATILKRNEGPQFQALPPYAATNDREAIAESYGYRIAIYDTQGKRLYTIAHPLPARRHSTDILEARAAAESLKHATTVEQKLAYALPAGGVNAFIDEPLPHLYLGGLQFDGTSRLWAIGPEGDSTFADVFAGEHFLGRLTLPCRDPEGNITINGAWLALRCHAAGDETHRAALQLYQIVESASKLQ